MLDIGKKRVRVGFAILSAVFLFGTTFLFLTPVSYSQTSNSNSFHDVAGFNGNASIYMTYDVPITNPYFLPLLNDSCTQQSSANPYHIKNLAGVAFGTPAFSSSGYFHTYEFYNPVDCVLRVCYGSAITTGTWQRQSYACGPNPYSFKYTTEGMTLSSEVKGLQSVSGQVCGATELPALNSTFSAYYSNPNLTKLENILAYGLIAITGLGFVVSGIQSYASYIQAGNHDISTSLNGPNTWMSSPIILAKAQSGDYSKFCNTTNSCGEEVICKGGQNILEFSMGSQISVNKNEFGTYGGDLIINASNYYGEFLCYQTICAYPIESNQLAAYSLLSIPIVPAYTIGGQVTGNDGQGVAGQSVVISEQYCCNGLPAFNNYYETTNQSGYYRFFAAPDHVYTISPVSDTSESQCLSATTTNGEGGDLNVNFKLPNTFQADFQETGLPSGTSWSVTLNGYTESTTGSSILFTEVTGNYSFSVSAVSFQSGTLTIVYEPSPSSGKISGYLREVVEGITYTKYTFASPVK